MSHQSGIGVSEGLASVLADAKSGKQVRMIKIEIEDEKLVPKDVVNNAADAEADFTAVQDLLLDEIPSYIAYRLDDDQWIMLSYVPDGSKVKARMLYASTRDTLRKEIGTNVDMYATSKSDYTYAGLQEFLANRKTSSHGAVLSANEILAKEEAKLEIDTGSQMEYVHSVQFPVAKVGLEKLKALNDKSAENCVILTVDPSKETIEFVSAGAVAPEALAAHVPSQDPCFCFYRWDHDHDGSAIQSIVFIYSCPDGSKIKLRMLFSTVKAAMMKAAEQEGVTSKNLEVTDPATEISEGVLRETVHPIPVAEKPRTGFAKPARPGRAGARGKARMTKQ